MSQMPDMAAPAHYPKPYSYKPMMDAIHKAKDAPPSIKEPPSISDKKKKKPPVVQSSPAPTIVPTLASPIDPQPGDLVFRYQMADGGKLVKLVRENELCLYHMKCLDGRQIFLEKKPGVSLALLVTGRQGQPLHSLACEL